MEDCDWFAQNVVLGSVGFRPPTLANVLAATFGGATFIVQYQLSDSLSDQKKSKKSHVRPPDSIHTFRNKQSAWTQTPPPRWLDCELNKPDFTVASVQKQWPTSSCKLLIKVILAFTKSFFLAVT